LIFATNSSGGAAGLTSLGIGGLVVTEQVFNLNGIGRLFVEAISRNDFILIQALVMLLAAVFVTMNLLVDLLYGVLDPRVRHA
jgi:peptide/nickel transport system permease protein